MWAWLVRLWGLFLGKDERYVIPEGVQEGEFVDEFGRERVGENGGYVGKIR